MRGSVWRNWRSGSGEPEEGTRGYFGRSSGAIWARQKEIQEARGCGGRGAVAPGVVPRGEVAGEGEEAHGFFYDWLANNGYYYSLSNSSSSLSSPRAFSLDRSNTYFPQLDFTLPRSPPPNTNTIHSDK